MNIVIPMAGRGSRFADAGYTVPKPFIPVGARTMVEVVVRNLRPRIAHRFIFLVLDEHLDHFDAGRRLAEAAPGCVIVPVREVTDGAACTVLLAREHINSEMPLMIANSDQYVDASIDDYLDVIETEDADGLIMTMWADHPKWSYLRLNDDRVVLEVVEKEVVSNVATVGVYNFRRGCDFVRAADAMVAADMRVDGEFYVAPVYNQLIAEGARIAWHSVGRVEDGMYGLGTPTDLGAFLASGLTT